MAREGFIGLEELTDKFQRLYEHLRGDWLEDAFLSAAEVFKREIESRTPVMTGRAKSHVLVYQRKRKGLTQKVGDEPSVLVGHEKRHAYYMYWYEYGTSKQTPRPFMRQAYESAYSAAWQAAEDKLKARIST